MGYNHWAGLGRIVRDPEVRYSASNNMCIARYTLAIDRRSKGGEDKTDFIRCVAFGKGGEFAEKYLHKGMRMLVSGAIQTDSYTDKDGKKVSTWEIVVASQDFADSKGDSTGNAPAPAQPQKSSENWMSIPADADDEGFPLTKGGARMPNRIIKESICTSENIDRLTEFEEITFYRLIVNVDDYGRLDARPKLIAARLFPLKDVKVKQVEDALFALAEAELIDLYKVGGKPYLQMRTWANHQTIRNKRSKYPGLDDAEHENEKENVEDTCEQLQADESKCPRNPIQSNPNMNPNPNPDSTEQKPAPVPPAPPVYTLPLNDGTEWGLAQEQYSEYVNLYPAVDVMCELRKMRGWLNANPERRKTKRGINSFVNRWLSKEQDRAKNPGTAPKKPQTRFHNFEERQDDSDEEMALAMMRNRLK